MQRVQKRAGKLTMKYLLGNLGVLLDEKTSFLSKKVERATIAVCKNYFDKSFVN